jgi:hypothetical protein
VDWLFSYADPSLDWDYAMITLIIRFIGVFVVMIVMQVAMQTAARVVGFIERDRGATSATPKPSDVDALAELESAPVDDATAAAIGVALALESGTSVSPQIGPQAASPWRTAGRIGQMRHGTR